MAFQDARATEGFTQASKVMAVVRFKEALAGTRTRSLTPSKLTAAPNFPVAVQVGPLVKVPVFGVARGIAGRRAGAFIEGVGGDEAGGGGRWHWPRWNS